MTDSERLVELHADVKLLLAYVMGTNGTPGLIRQMADLQAFRNKALGALGLLSVLGGLLVAKLSL